MTFDAGNVLHASDLNTNFSQLQAGMVPSGTVVAFPGPVANIPPGWVLCDGTAYNGALPAYAALYAAIGVANGGNSSAMEFNVPDYRGYFLRGLDTSGAVDPDVGSRTAARTGGNPDGGVGSLEEDAFGAHAHPINDPQHGHPMSTPVSIGGNWTFGGNNWAVALNNGAANLVAGNAPTGITVLNSGGSETRPKNIAVNYIIKL